LLSQPCPHDAGAIVTPQGGELADAGLVEGGSGRIRVEDCGRARAPASRECACRGCGSRDVRRSSVRTPLPLRIAGMHLWRCRECGALFPLRRRWLA